LPDRYLGAHPGFDVTYHVRLGDVGRTWEIRCTEHTARVRRGATRREPDVVIGTDATTWLRLRRGDLSGVEAFSQRLLYVRGDLDRAVGFEGMWRLPDGRPPLLRVHDVHLPGRRVSVMTMGQGREVLLIHGLGATKASFYDTAAALSQDGYRVHALDLPGFGSSSKPATGPYTARWFADTVVDLMDRLMIDRAHIVGNSMGGRVALEVALREPERVGALALLCPAVAFVKRGYHPIVRIARPELAFLPHKFRRAMVSSTFHGLFHDTDALDPYVSDVVIDEFQRLYASPSARFVRQARLLPAPGRPRAPGPVRLGVARHADPAGLQTPRRRVAPARRADRARRLRACPAGRAPRSDQRADPALPRAVRRARWSATPGARGRVDSGP
jgi:pimeloyl-ACP methyl ester carboxylesterase